MMQQRFSLRYALFSCTFAVSSLLAGCALQTTSTVVDEPVAGAAFSGSVHGGQQAISGAKVYLLAVNTTGSGGQGISPATTNASLSLLNNSVQGAASDSIGYYVTTNSAGSFSISGDFNCTSGYAQGSTTKITIPATTQVYLYALGGKPVIDGTAANSAIGLLAALGPCSSITSGTKVNVNEVTTVGTGYAFAGYASDATHISTSGTALATTGVNNAYTTFGNLVNVSAGTPATATTGGNGVVPAASIYTLADILAACVNSSGPSSNACSTVFQYMQSTTQVTGGGTSPTDTATAIINLAHYPWPTQAGMDALYALVPSTAAPFVGGLTSEPNDYSLTISYSGGNLNQAKALAIDKAGNIWIANSGGNTISEASPSGTFLQSGYAGVGITAPTSLAIDTAGSIWVGSAAGITKVVPGSTLTSTAFTPTNGTNVNGVSVDSYGNILYVSSAAVPGTLGSINSSGTQVASISSAKLNAAPSSVAVGASKNIWVGQTGSTTGYLTGFTETATTLTYSTQATALANVSSIAFDPSSLLYVTEQGQNYYIFQYNPADTTSQTYFDGQSILYPTSVALDSQANEWIASRGASSNNAWINEFNTYDFDLGPTNAGLEGNNSYAGPYCIAVDGSGNTWSVNYSSTPNTQLVEMVGSAAPVVTPLVANILSPYTHPASQP